MLETRLLDTPLQDLMMLSKGHHFKQCPLKLYFRWYIVILLSLKSFVNIAFVVIECNLSMLLGKRNNYKHEIEFDFNILFSCNTMLIRRFWWKCNCKLIWVPQPLGKDRYRMLPICNPGNSQTWWFVSRWW